MVRIVHAGSLDIDSFKSSRREFLPIIAVRKSACYTTYPQLHTLSDFCRHFGPHNNIRYSESSTWFEDAERLLQHTGFVAGQIDHAVRYDDIHGVIGQWDSPDLAFWKFNVRQARLPLVVLGYGKHLVGHVQTKRFSGWTDAARRQQNVDPAT